MNLIGQIKYYMNMGFACIMVAGVLALAVLWYLLKIKKVVAREEKVDRSKFVRTDSLSYVPIQDVYYDDTFDSDGMYAITDKLFVGGISVKGYEYFSASPAARVETISNSVAFFDVVDSPITFRGTSVASDLSANIKEYEKVIKRLAGELMELDTEYQATLTAGEDNIDDPETYQYYEKKLDELQSVIFAKNHMIDECSTVIQYMKAMEGDSAHNKLASKQNATQIIFSYTHNPDLYSKELSKEEICLKAREALNAKARAFTDALGYCHFRAKRLTCRELVSLVRKYNFPVTGEDSSMEDLLESSYTSLFVSCDSLLDAQRDNLGEVQYEIMLEEYEENLDKLLQQQRNQIVRKASKLKEDTLEQALSELERGGAL